MVAASRPGEATGPGSLGLGCLRVVIVLLAIGSSASAARRNFQYPTNFRIESGFQRNEASTRFNDFRISSYESRDDQESPDYRLAASDRFKASKPEDFPSRRSKSNIRREIEENASANSRRFVDDFDLDESLESWNKEDDVDEQQISNADRLASFLRDLADTRKTNDYEGVEPGRRQGRRRKLTSHEQGLLLVETLRKKRNYTNLASSGGVDDHRGYSSNAVNSGIMDMLGRSTSRSVPQENLILQLPPKKPFIIFQLEKLS